MLKIWVFSGITAFPAWRRFLVWSNLKTHFWFWTHLAHIVQVSGPTAHIYAQQICETMLNKIWHVTQKKVQGLWFHTFDKIGFWLSKHHRSKPCSRNICLSQDVSGSWELSAMELVVMYLRTCAIRLLAGGWCRIMVSNPVRSKQCGTQ